MQLTKRILKTNFKNLRIFPIAAMMLLPLGSFAQTKTTATPDSKENRAEVGYKQRHSSFAGADGIYADGIKIKRDLSILKEIQEERVLSAEEAPADDIYGGLWSSKYVNAYRDLQNVPDTFNINLKNFTIPTRGYVTSHFGPRRRRMHYGIDLKVQIGDTISAAFDGKVRIKQYDRRGYGYYVVVRHDNGLETVYGHLSEFLVDEGDVVKSGTPIALGGNTGRSTGPHLHLEFRFLGKPINPAAIVDFDNKVCHRDNFLITPNTFNYPASRRGVRYDTSTMYANANKTRSSKNIKNKFASGKVSYHRVKKGDTLSRIAQRYGVSVKKLCSLNNINTRTSIRPGKTLRIS